MMRYLKHIRSIRFYISIFVLILSSCSSKSNQEEYYYSYFYEGDSLPTKYMIRKVGTENGVRTESLLFYNSDLLFDHKEDEKFVIEEGSLNKVTIKDDTTIVKPYLTTLSNDCIKYLYDDEQLNSMLSTELCFLGKEDVTVKNTVYDEAYKFRKRKGTLDGVETIIYYDSSFIPIKEEYVSGYTSKYRMVRLDTPIAIKK